MVLGAQEEEEVRYPFPKLGVVQEVETVTWESHTCVAWQPSHTAEHQDEEPPQWGLEQSELQELLQGVLGVVWDMASEGQTLKHHMLATERETEKDLDAGEGAWAHRHPDLLGNQSHDLREALRSHHP